MFKSYCIYMCTFSGVLEMLVCVTIKMLRNPCYATKSSKFQRNPSNSQDDAIIVKNWGGKREVFLSFRISGGFLLRTSASTSSLLTPVNSGYYFEILKLGPSLLPEALLQPTSLAQISVARTMNQLTLQKNSASTFMKSSPATKLFGRAHAA